MAADRQSSTSSTARVRSRRRCELRRGDGGLRVERLERLADVGRDEWDALVDGRGFYLSHGWLQTVEPNPRARPQYLLARSNDRLVGALPLYRVTGETSPYYDPARLRRLLGVAGDFLVAGGRRAYRNGFPLDARLPPARLARVVAAIVREALDCAAEQGMAGVAWFFVPTRMAEAIAGAAPFRLELDIAEAELTADPPGLEAYLGRLRSRRRRDIRRELTGFRAAGWTVTEEPIAECWREAAPLLANVQERYGRRGSIEACEDLLLRQATCVGDRAVVFACRDERGRLGAYSLMYRWRDALYARLVGFNYETLRNAYEYFNLVYYAPLDYMRRHGLRRLHLGIESLEAKVLRGATLTPLWAGATFKNETGDSGLIGPDRDLVASYREQLPPFGGATRDEDWSPRA